MTKTELITRISDELGLTKKEAEKNFNGIFFCYQRCSFRRWYNSD